MFYSPFWAMAETMWGLAGGGKLLGPAKNVDRFYALPQWFYLPDLLRTSSQSGRWRELVADVGAGLLVGG